MRRTFHTHRAGRAVEKLVLRPVSTKSTAARRGRVGRPAADDTHWREEEPYHEHDLWSIRLKGLCCINVGLTNCLIDSATGHSIFRDLTLDRRHAAPMRHGLANHHGSIVMER